MNFDEIFGKRRSVGMAYLFHIFFGFGAFGAHKFYLNKVGMGILYFFTWGLFGIGALVDLFTLPNQVREFNNAQALEDISNRLNLNDKQAQHSMADDEKIILKIAKAKNGIVTPMDIAVESPISMDKAKKKLDEFVSKGFADMEVSKTGMVLYRIFGLYTDKH